MAFRDQTQEVVRGRRSPSDSRNQACSPGTERIINGTVNAIPPEHARYCHAFTDPSYSLAFSIEDQATTFFFRQYVWQDSVFSKGGWDFLPAVYSHERSGGLIADSISALGLAGLSHMRQETTPSLANAKYARALRGLNRSLQDPEEAKSDKTLITVNLLSSYELSNCRDVQSLSAWAKHVDGGSALLRLRGRDQLKTPLGRRLYIQMRTQICLSCTHRCLRVPDYICSWTEIEQEDEPIEDKYASRLMRICIQLCNIQATLSEDPTYPQIRAPAELFDCDRKFQDWADNIPPELQYTTQLTSDNDPFVFRGTYHTYTGIWTALIWNHYRSMRILMQSLIYTCYQHLSNSYTTIPSPRHEYHHPYCEEIKQADDFMLNLALDICASIPFYVGYHKQNPSRNIIINAACGNLMAWPLYAVAAGNLQNDEIMGWTTDRLKQISRATGIMQGKAIADMLLNKRRLQKQDMEAKLDSLGEDAKAVQEDDSINRA